MVPRERRRDILTWWEIDPNDPFNWRCYQQLMSPGCFQRSKLFHFLFDGNSSGTIYGRCPWYQLSVYFNCFVLHVLTVTLPFHLHFLRLFSIFFQSSFCFCALALRWFGVLWCLILIMLPESFLPVHTVTAGVMSNGYFPERSWCGLSEFGCPAQLSDTGEWQDRVGIWTQWC